jgi:hypothetical protein
MTLGLPLGELERLEAGDDFSAKAANGPSVLTQYDDTAARQQQLGQSQHPGLQEQQLHRGASGSSDRSWEAEGAATTSTGETTVPVPELPVLPNPAAEAEFIAAVMAPDSYKQLEQSFPASSTGEGGDPSQQQLSSRMVSSV